MKIENLVNKLFETREKANSFHYNIESRSIHIIMEEYYTEILELTDKLVEVYIGKYDTIGDYISIVDEESIKNNDILNYFENAIKCIKHCSEETFNKEEDTHLLSIVDDIYNLLYRTIYKIKVLTKNETY